MSVRIRLAALALPLLAGLSGCSGGSCPAPARRFTAPSAALGSYAAMRSPARIFRGDARVDRRDAEGRIRGTVLMIIERPDRVRFDAMTQFGPAAVLTSDGETFALTDLREDRFFVGPTCPQNIARLLGMPLTAAEIAQLLVGEAPLIEAVDESLRCDGGTYRIERRAADGTTQRLALEIRQADLAQAPELHRLRLRESEVRAADGSLSWRVTWDDYQFVEDPLSDATPRMGVMMPHRIRFERPAEGIDTLVRFESIDLNADIPADAFVQQVRPGLSVEPVDCD